jgi:hypothetical protein
MKILVRCAGCGAVVGVQKRFSYGGPDNDWYTDYGGLEPNEKYGGEHEGEQYCCRCYRDQVKREECSA